MDITRESWSPGSNDSSSEAQQQQQSSDDEWQSCYLISTDVRNGLLGFMQYLQGRRKAILCKFDNDDASSKSLLVVPYDPPPHSLDKLPDGIDMNQIFER